MISWLRTVNRQKNYFFKKHKLNLKLNLISLLAFRSGSAARDNAADIKHLVMPFIGKGIGDAIVIGGVIETLVQNNYKVSVIADKRTHFLFEGWSNIENLIFYTPSEQKAIAKKLKSIAPFTFIDSHEITHSSIHSFNLIKRSKPSLTIGFNNTYKIYDQTVNLSDPLGHISTRYVDLLHFLGITSASSYDYSFIIPEQNRDEGRAVLDNFPDKKIITFIPYGSVRERFFSNEQINAILDYFAQYEEQIEVIIIGEQHKIKDISNRKNVHKNTCHSFFTAAQLLKESDLVVTPDTSLVHLANAFNKRMVCVYPFKILSNGANNADTWGPNYDNAVQIKLAEIRIMDADIKLIIDQIDAETQKIVNPIV